MTPERASDIVYNCPAPYSYDLFEHFIEYYNVTDPKQMPHSPCCVAFRLLKIA
jgi:hypothetical protein